MSVVNFNGYIYFSKDRGILYSGTAKSKANFFVIHETSPYCIDNNIMPPNVYLCMISLAILLLIYAAHILRYRFFTLT